MARKERTPYESDLAYIHDKGYGDFANRSAPGLLKLLRQSGITEGRIVDLGCGSGIWARHLTDAGHRVLGVDLSPAMIEIARARVPEGEFQIASFLQFPLPPCRAVTALGEVFNYLFDPSNSLGALQQVCTRVFRALSRGGVFIFDVAEPGRHKGVTQRFAEGNDWACLVEIQHDLTRARLTRRIVSFRKIGDSYRRHEEIHPQQLYQGRRVARMLREIGFRVRLVRAYGDYPLFDKVVGIVARKP
jgi:SAM-dependent methyltransferase